MISKSELLKKIRKHARNFSSAVSPPKEIDQKSINHALTLIDLIAKESTFGCKKKLSIKIPNFLKVLRIGKNLDFLISNSDKKDLLDFTLKTKNVDNKDKFKNAEKKLLKLLSTKSC